MLGGALCVIFFGEVVVMIRMSSLSLARQWHALVRGGGGKGGDQVSSGKIGFEDWGVLYP